jgi:hypothetical protein
MKCECLAVLIQPPSLHQRYRSLRHDRRPHCHPLQEGRPPLRAGTPAFKSCLINFTQHPSLRYLRHFFFIFFIPLVHSDRVYRPCLLRLWSYRAGLLLQRWQHVLIQAASPLWASHPFPHFHTFLPVLQAPSSLSPNFGRFVGP